MPDDDLNTDPVEGQEDNIEAEATSTPSYVTTEQFETLRSQMVEQIGRAVGDAVGSAIQATRPAAPTPERTALPSGPSAEDLVAAYEAGDAHRMANLMSQMTSAAEERAYQRARSESDTKLNIGISAVSNLAEQMAQKDLKHYKRYEKEIKNYLSQMDAGIKITPEIFKYAHDLVVGQHAEELVAEAEERVRRAPTSSTQVPGGTNSRAAAEGKAPIPSVAQIAGAEVAAWLQSQGMTEDDWARKRGYESWEHMITSERSGRAIREDKRKDRRMAMVGRRAS